MAIITVDFDGTLYQGNSFKVMFLAAKKEFKMKEWGVVATGLIKASFLRLIKGKEAFRHQFFRSFAKSFKGKTKGELDAFFENLVMLGKNDVHRELVKKMKEHQKQGDTVIVLSGALHPFLKAFIKEVGLDVHVISTDLLYDQNGICTGEIGTIINGDEKVKKVQAWLKEKEEDGSFEIWAYADSESDIPLFKFAKHPIVVNPNHEMVEIAKENDWPIFAS